MPFTLNERDRRFEAVRGRMRAEDLDALIVFGTAGTGIPFNGNFTYLANQTLFYASAALYFPLDGEPVSFVPGENQIIDGQRTTWIDNMSLTRQPVADLCDHVTRGPTPARIGISSLASLPARLHDQLRDALPEAEFTDAGPLILAVRDNKSAEEIAVARRAAEIADLGFECSLEILKPGLSELAWRAEVERVMTAAGADGGFNMLGAGRPDGDSDDIFRGFVVPPTEREFLDGDLALLEISPRVEGYYNQIVRLVSIGEPGEDIARAHAVCAEAKEKGAAGLKPGASFDEVMEPVRESLAASGYDTKPVATAHTIGLDLSETIINPSTPGEISEGMVVTVHPMIEIGDWRQLFVGETYVVTAAGPEALNRSADRIYVTS